MPADPNRPLTAQTCAVAQARLQEARLGSPLLSAEENAHVLRNARADAARLCGTSDTEGRAPAPVSPATRLPAWG